jgi:Tfp pilus assembly PilM family ATPase
MPLTTTILGLSFCERRVQAAVITHEGESHTLLAIDEWPDTITTSGNNDGMGTEDFLETLQTFLRVNRVRPDKVSLALDSSRLFISTIPIEENTSRLERSEFIQWEITQYFPDAHPGEFITAVHPLTDNRIDRWIRALSVSARRSEVQPLQRALKRAGLDVFVIDVDHFSADTALKVNYPDASRKYLALAGIKESRVDISLIRQGVLEAYSYHSVSSNTEIVNTIAGLSREVSGLHSVVTYGAYLDPDLLAHIRQGSSILVEALNPLRHVRVLESLFIADHLSVPSYRFIPAIGVALRQD